MKLIDKDALEAEILNRVKKIAAIDVGDCKELEAIYGAKCHALHGILSFINTLEVKDENAIKRDWYNEGYIKGRKEANIPARELRLPSTLDFINELPVNKDLEEAAKYHRSHGNYGGDINLAMEESFKAGACWHEQQLS